MDVYASGAPNAENQSSPWEESGMSNKFNTALKSTVAAVALVVTGGAAQAQETIKVTFISGLPIVTTVVAAAVNKFVPEIDRALAETGNYKINWNLAHSGQVVKPRGELEGLEAGLGDVGIVVTAFHADKVPLYEVSFKTPFTTPDLDLVAPQPTAPPASADPLVDGQ